MGPAKILIALAVIAAFAAPAYGASRLETIRQRGHLTCGVAPKFAGFSQLDPSGQVVGFEPDLCRAVAAAIFGDRNKVRFVAAASLEDFQHDQDLDLVGRRLTPTLRREAMDDVQFSPIVFYDGTAFLISNRHPWRTAAGLAGHSICVAKGSEAEDALTVFFQRRRARYRKRASANVDAAAAAFFAGRCDALAADLSQIASERAGRDQGVTRYAILPQLISKAPLALLMHRGDAQFALIVRWTIFALIEAEELGVSSSNVGQKISAHDQEIDALLDQGAAETRALGLHRNWVEQVIRGVGNYGELYDRNLGARSSIKLPRGLNALWTDGGLMYAPPIH